MRYAKEPPIGFRFLPGLLLVVEIVAPKHLSSRRSIAPGSRDKGQYENMYASRYEGWLFLLAVCVLAHQHLARFPLTPTVLVLDETSCG